MIVTNTQSTAGPIRYCYDNILTLLCYFKKQKTKMEIALRVTLLFEPVHSDIVQRFTLTVEYLCGFYQGAE